MCAIAKKFYALVENPETKTSLKNYYRTLKLVEIDLKRQSTLEICNLSSDLGMDEGKNDPIPIGLFQGTFLYLDGKKLRRFDIEKKKVITGKSDKIIIKQSPWDWICLEGKIYYAIQYERKVIIYRLDLEKGTTKEIFEYNSVDVFGRPEVSLGFRQGRAVVLDVDKDYLYCQGYGIPRRGGEMVRLFRFERETVNYLPYAYTDQFAYYIDDRLRLRRLDKNTLRSSIIAYGVMDVKGTSEGLYVQFYAPDVSLDTYIDRSDDQVIDQKSDIADSCDLYYMDFNGENEEQLWVG